jgi:hypothetical protein
MQDDTKPLRHYNITAASRVLVTKGAGAAAQQALAGNATLPPDLLHMYPPACNHGSYLQHHIFKRHPCNTNNMLDLG